MMAAAMEVTAKTRGIGPTAAPGSSAPESSGPESTAPVLLLLAGEWLVGVEAIVVRAVLRAGLDRPSSKEVLIHLEDLLGVSTREPRARKKRRLLVTGGRREWQVAVDDVIGSVPVDGLKASSLPPVLANFGAPRWWLGVGWHGGRAVLLMDLLSALESISCPGPCAPSGRVEGPDSRWDVP